VLELHRDENAMSSEPQLFSIINLLVLGGRCYGAVNQHSTYRYAIFSCFLHECMNRSEVLSDRIETDGK